MAAETASDDNNNNNNIENGGNCGERRPIMGESPSKQQSLRQDFEHAAAETYLITRLAFILLSYLGVGYRWITRVLALLCYAVLLMPGFLQVGYYYFFSSQVHRSVIYGEQPRNRLDLYLPQNTKGRKPVVIFVTGGAWIIGYKAWGSFLGKQFIERDIIVACLDYRNFPQGTISDMIKDVSQGISFVCNNIASCGGDPDRIYLVGQSAGAHISACAILQQSIRESQGESSSWSMSQIKAYFALSGGVSAFCDAIFIAGQPKTTSMLVVRLLMSEPSKSLYIEALGIGYNMLNLVDHFHNRGLYRSIFLSIMEGEKSLVKFSPELLVQDKSVAKAVSILPPVILFHGTKDHSIPSDASESFADTLRKAGAHAEVILFEGKTHTDLFVQDPLRGGKDELFEHMVSIIHAGDEDALAKDAMAPPMKRLVPEILLKIAREISPF